MGCVVYLLVFAAQLALIILIWEHVHWSVALYLTIDAIGEYLKALNDRLDRGGD